MAIGTAAGVRTEAFITRMDTPLGRAVGNAVEIVECIETLQGRGPADLEALVLRLGSRMLQLGGRATSDEDGARQLRAAMASGAGLDKLRALIARQGGDARVVDDTRRFPQAAFTHPVPAARAGVVTGLDALLVGRASVALGAGRDKKGDAVDLAAGLRLLKKPGERGDRPASR